jgi:hypothetical protein
MQGRGRREREGEYFEFIYVENFPRMSVKNIAFPHFFKETEDISNYKETHTYR